VKTMSTPMKGLDKNAKAKEALNVTIIEDEYARGVVEKGVQMLDALKREKDAINEYVFSRRIDEIRESLDRVLRCIIDDPDKAHRIRKMNSYYLPTAVKLLESYRSARRQGATTIAASSTRQDVLSTLDQLKDALNAVRDGMLRDDLEDIDIEIDVFERMLKSDGLAEDEVTDSLRQTAHAAAKEIPMSKAPAVKPTAAPAAKKPVQQEKPAPQPVAKPAAQPAPAPVEKPAEPEYKPEGVQLDYQVQTEEAERTPVPYLNVPAATASARQLQQGAPVLQVPQAPTAPDFAQESNQESKA